MLWMHGEIRSYDAAAGMVMLWMHGEMRSHFYDRAPGMVASGGTSCTVSWCPEEAFS